MAEVVNLGRARKNRQKMQKRAKAAENSVKFGRSKAQKTAAKQQRDADSRRLELHRIEQDD